LKILDGCFVAIEYVLTLDDGQVVEQSPLGEPLGFTVGAEQVARGLEQALLGMPEGFEGRIEVAPADGFGERNEELLKEMPKGMIPAEATLEPGMVLQTDGPEGPVNFMVAEVRDDVIVADFNHPLAGKRLFFDVRVVRVSEGPAA